MTDRAPLGRILMVLAICTGLSVAPGLGTAEVNAYSAISQLKGFDTCQAPTSTTMDKWWLNSPYFNIGIYIGGANRACSQPYLTSSWVSHNQSEGWGFLPIWVGPQMPHGQCTTNYYNTYITLNTTTAYNQGYSEAASAVSAAAALGMDTTNMPLIYDLEAYNGDATCRNVAKYFLKGWATYLALAPAKKSGVYGSACGSYINDFATNGHPPDFIWAAQWDSNSHTSVLSCVNSGNWVLSQRHKQYVGPNAETYGGVAITIDNDCSNGPVYYSANTYGTDCP